MVSMRAPMNAKMNLRVPRRVGNLLRSSVTFILFGGALLDGRVIPSNQDLSKSIAV
jgi:hypothetical protein